MAINKKRIEKNQQIIDEINGYIRERKLLFKKTYIEDEDNKVYIFELLDGEKSIGNIQVSVSQDSISQPKGRRLRSGIEIEDEVIHINWINVEKDYLGKKYGTIILIYAISSILMENPNIEYAKLDDDSDRSSDIKNIYSSILFVHDEHTELIGNFKKTLLNGPEKTAYIGYDKYFNILLNKILDIKRKQKSGKKKIQKKFTCKRKKNKKKSTCKRKKNKKITRKRGKNTKYFK